MSESAPKPVLDLFAQMLSHAEQSTLCYGEASCLPVENYTSESRLAAEKKTLFKHYPLIVGHASELAEEEVLAVNIAEVPIVICKDKQGEIKAFLNVCRHRGMQLVDATTACKRTSLVCPYHGWTYGLDGQFKQCLHAEAFPDLNAEKTALVALPCEVWHDLIWVIPTPGQSIDVSAFLGPVADDLIYFLGKSVLHRRVDTQHRANWKLIIDAFLDGYHIRVLHRDSIYPFFKDALVVSDEVGQHIRSTVARRKIDEVVGKGSEAWDLREHCTFSHYIFPNTIIVFHPDYASVISVYPLGTDQLRWVHQMLIPADQAGPEQEAHWENTFQLIEQTVFQAEDLFAAEGIQAGLNSGANQTITIGRLEHAIAGFHRIVDEALSETRK